MANYYVSPITHFGDVSPVESITLRAIDEAVSPAGAAMTCFSEIVAARVTDEDEAELIAVVKVADGEVELSFHRVLASARPVTRAAALRGFAEVAGA